jgi:hypothetical protein
VKIIVKWLLACVAGIVIIATIVVVIGWLHGPRAGKHLSTLDAESKEALVMDRSTSEYQTLTRRYASQLTKYKDKPVAFINAYDHVTALVCDETSVIQTVLKLGPPPGYGGR